MRKLREQLVISLGLSCVVAAFCLSSAGSKIEKPPSAAIARISHEGGCVNIFAGVSNKQVQHPSKKMERPERWSSDHMLFNGGYFQ